MNLYSVFYCTMYNSFVLVVLGGFLVCIGSFMFFGGVCYNAYGYTQQHFMLNEFFMEHILIAFKCILNWIMGNIVLPQIWLASGSRCAFPSFSMFYWPFVWFICILLLFLFDFFFLFFSPGVVFFLVIFATVLPYFFFRFNLFKSFSERTKQIVTIRKRIHFALSLPKWIHFNCFELFSIFRSFHLLLP